ncbi:MAG: septum site-determining protein MinD [Caldisericaceae bacterium]
MGRVIVVTAGKGGVGKTTITANLGASLAKLGKSTVLIDMDIGLRNLDVVMGLENRVVFNIIDVINGKCKINQALVRDKHIENLFLLPASQIHSKDDVDVNRVVDVVSVLENNFDYVLLDSPAGIEKGFESSVAPAKEALIVVTPDVSSVRDADRVIGIVESKEILSISLIINRYDINLVSKKKALNFESIVNILDIDVLGVVPEDKAIIETTNMGEILVNYLPGSPSAKEFGQIAKRLEGEDIPIQLEKPKGFFGNIFRRE